MEGKHGLAAFARSEPGRLGFRHGIVKDNILLAGKPRGTGWSAVDTSGLDTVEKASGGFFIAGRKGFPFGLEIGVKAFGYHDVYIYIIMLGLMQRATGYADVGMANEKRTLE